MFPEEKNKIEELKKTLYSRENFKQDNPIHDLPRKTYEVKDQWATPTGVVTKPVKRWPIGRILVWFSVIFFFVAFVIAGFIFYNGYNTVSADNVEISITGPTTIDAGREATFAIAIDNKNKIDLQDVYLNIEYPSGARRSAIQTDSLTLERIPLGTIVSGFRVDKTISAVFFGLQGTQEKIQISLEYHVLGSTNLFGKNKEYVFTLGSGPISMTISHPEEINSGQDVTFSVTVTSNSSAVLSNVALNANYPFGFTFKNALPAPSVDNSVWKIGSLSPGEKRVITFVGRLEGQENEQRAFKFNVGIINPADSKQIATTFYAGTETISIQRPFIGLDLAFNGNSVDNYNTFAGESISATLDYSNNTATPLVDGVITVKLNGAILDKSGIVQGQGFYQSIDNTITWDKRSVPALAVINPGDQGRVQFTLKTLPFSNGSLYSKSSQKITITANVSTTQVSNGGITPISSAISRTASINSNITLISKALFNGTIFKNTGSIPPKAEKPTTYTINWAIANTFNNTSGVTVSAVLPSYVKFINNVSPTGEVVTYDEVSGRVVWNAGNIKTNTGYVSAPRQVFFQVSILPSLTQVGTVPMLLGESVLKATDTFTESPLSAVAGALTTDIVSDSLYQSGIGVVVK